jgi:hypothetical protein
MIFIPKQRPDWSPPSWHQQESETTSNRRESSLTLAASFHPGSRCCRSVGAEAPVSIWAAAPLSRPRSASPISSKLTGCFALGGSRRAGCGPRREDRALRPGDGRKPMRTSVGAKECAGAAGLRYSKHRIHHVASHPSGNTPPPPSCPKLFVKDRLNTLSVGEIVMRKFYRAFARRTQSDDRTLRLAVFSIAVAVVVATMLSKLLA